MPTFTPRPSQAKILDTLLATDVPQRVGVSAAPGSGKTHILSYLASQMVRRVNDEQEVLIVTLVNAAVDNFRRRVNEFIREQGLLPGFNYRVCTLHSLAHEIVRQRPALVGLSEEFAVEDERRTQQILRDVTHGWLSENGELLLDYLASDINQQKVFRKNLPDLVLSMAQGFIKQAKDMGLTPPVLQEKLRPISDLPLAKLGLDIYQEYQNRLARTGVDFDDLIRLAAQAITIDPDYLARLQEKWPIILEDEAQDSSLLQEQILHALVGETGTWVRVGDPNQAIYETFTTANPEHLRSFLRQPNVVGLTMPESGRFSVSIMRLANELIRWTMTEHPQAQVRNALSQPFIEPTPPDDPQPNPPDMPKQVHLRREKYQPEQEIKMVVKSAKKWLEQNPGKSVAILDARNKRGVDIANALRQVDVPYVELLKSTTATRSTAGVLGNILRYLAHPEDTRLLTIAYRAWRRDQWQDEFYQPIFRQIEATLKQCRHVEDYLWPQPGQDWLESEAVADLIQWGIGEFDRFGLSQEGLDAVPQLSPDEFDSGDLAAADLARQEQVAHLSAADRSANFVRGELRRFKRLVRRWQEATILPIDQLILTLSQDLFTKPSDLALSHKFALVLHQWAVKDPTYRLPSFVEILAEVARNERAFIGFDEETLDPEYLKDKVTIATMHRAKGLEWDRVYLMGLNNYSFPSGEPYDSYFSEKWFIRNSLNMEAETIAQLQALANETTYNEGAATQQARFDLVRERLRLLFVGLTRARQELVITWNIGRPMPNKSENQPALPFVALQSWWGEK